MTRPTTQSRRNFLALAAGVVAAPVLLRADETSPSPSRIISCAPNLTELIFALGAGDAVVGVTPFCEFPPEAKALPKYGDLFNPSLEAMFAAKPDAIVTVPGNRKVIDFFEGRPGVRIFEANDCDTLEQIAETTRRLGAFLGREAKAAELVAGTEKELARLRAKVEGREPLPTLVVLGRDRGALTNLTAIGGGGYLSELLLVAGGRNVIDPKLGLYPQLNREALLSHRPKVIVELGHAGDTPEARAEMRSAWAPLKGVVPAVRDGAMAIVADKHLTIPGAHLERDARTLADALRPFLKP